MPIALRYERWSAASWDRSDPGRHVLLGVERWVCRQRSRFQQIAVAELPDYGRALFLDGLVQFTASDEFVYHEHLVRPALWSHPAPRRALVLGGGDGLALRELLADPRLERAVLVELDGAVIEVCREHFVPLHGNSFDDPRVEIVSGDARDYLEESDDRFDLIVVDLVDPYALDGIRLYDEIMGQARAALAPGGVLTTHGESPEPPNHCALRVFALLARTFPHVALHRAGIQSFSKEWGFLLASDARDFEAAPISVQWARSARAVVPERYPAAFRLPPFMQAQLDRLKVESDLTNLPYRPQVEWLEA